MTIGVDTNILIRHLTQDPPEQARRATARLREARRNDLLLLDVHVAECVFVLEGPYGQSKSEIGELLGSLLGFGSIRLEHESTIRRSLDLYCAGFDFADAYLVAAAEEAGISQVLSFDRFDARLKKHSKVRRVEP